MSRLDSYKTYGMAQADLRDYQVSLAINPATARVLIYKWEIKLKR